MNRELYELSYSMKKNFQRKVLKIIFFVILIFAAINLILNFVIYPVRQVSDSMAPDAGKNSCIFFSPLKKYYGRGSVVLLNDRNPETPGFGGNVLDLFTGFFTARQFFFTERENRMGNHGQIRRVIGIPGDTIYMRDYVVYIKPEGEKHFLTEFELIPDAYNLNVTAAPAGWDTSLGVAGSFDEMTLGENQYFVLGDNRNSCVDCRLWGPVTDEDIKAGAIFQFFPLNKFKFF